MTHNPTVWEERVVVPARPAKDQCAEAATELEGTIRTIEAWGVRLPKASRSEQALAVLRDIARTGLFAPHQRGDSLGIRGLEFALDFGAIARTLPPSRVADLRKDLQDANRGPLDPPDSERGALQLQSQLTVRAAIELMGVTVDHPR
jgi:hypothetical protein